MSETRTLDAPTMTKLERARAIIAGTLTEPVLEPSPMALANLERAFEMNGVVPTAKARRHQLNCVSLEEHYAGKGPVACYNTGEGLIVLADGDDAYPLMRQLAGDQSGRLEVHFPVDAIAIRLYR